MNAIRADEESLRTGIHSIYVDQYDWEMVIIFHNSHALMISIFRLFPRNKELLIFWSKLSRRSIQQLFKQNRWYVQSLDWSPICQRTSPLFILRILQKVILVCLLSKGKMPFAKRTGQYLLLELRKADLQIMMIGQHQPRKERDSTEICSFGTRLLEEGIVCLSFIFSFISYFQSISLIITGLISKLQKFLNWFHFIVLSCLQWESELILSHCWLNLRFEASLHVLPCLGIVHCCLVNCRSALEVELGNQDSPCCCFKNVTSVKFSQVVGLKMSEQSVQSWELTFCNSKQINGKTIVSFQMILFCFVLFCFALLCFALLCFVFKKDLFLFGKFHKWRSW